MATELENCRFFAQTTARATQNCFRLPIHLPQWSKVSHLTARQGIWITHPFLAIVHPPLHQPCLHATIVASTVNIFSSYGFSVPTDHLHEAICSQVARLLKEERQRRGLSLNLLAEKAGLSRQTITFVEQELRIPSLETLLRITTALGVDLEKIIARARKLASSKAK